MHGRAGGKKCKPAASVEHVVTVHTSRWAFVSSIRIYPNGLPGRGVVRPWPEGNVLPGHLFAASPSAQCIDLQSYL